MIGRICTTEGTENTEVSNVWNFFRPRFQCLEEMFPNIGKIFTAAALAAPSANLLKTSRAAGVFKK